MIYSVRELCCTLLGGLLLVAAEHSRWDIALVAFLVLLPYTRMREWDNARHEDWLRRDQLERDTLTLLPPAKGNGSGKVTRQ